MNGPGKAACPALTVRQALQGTDGTVFIPIHRWVEDHLGIDIDTPLETLRWRLTYAERMLAVLRALWDDMECESHDGYRYHDGTTALARLMREHPEVAALVTTQDITDSPVSP